MFKMLIVEDERWEREGLADFLDWNSFNIEIAGTACDGIDGLEQALKIRPDIIITDIKMPGLDGITMSKKIKEFLPDVKIIILTGYDDFHYAKEAIGFNASGYILKIMDEEELMQVIRKVVLECERELERTEREYSMNSKLEENLLSARTAFFMDLLEGRAGAEELQKKFIDFAVAAYVDDEFIAAVICLPAEQTSQAAGEILEEVRQKHQGEMIFHTINPVMGEAVFCFRKPEPEGITPEVCLAEMCVWAEAQYGIRLLGGIGAPAAGIGNIRHSYLQARHAMEYGFFWKVPGVQSYLQMEALQRAFTGNAGEFLIQGSYFSKQLIHSLRSMEEERVEILIGEMFAHIRTYRGASREFLLNYLQNIINEVSILVYHMNKDFDQGNIQELLIPGESQQLRSLDDVEENIRRYVGTACEALSDKRNGKDDPVIRKVIRLIEERYSTDISLKLIAAEVFLSPNYLGSIFRKSTGKSINDYISEYRMEKAKELLLSPANRVNWVAARVGMPNTSYFCTIFKNTYGMAPGEFQESIAKNNG